MSNGDCPHDIIAKHRLSNSGRRGAAMNPDVVSPLCDPITSEPLQLIHESLDKEVLVSVNSGKRFPASEHSRRGIYLVVVLKVRSRVSLIY
jgi:hypothetical protein